MANLIGQKKLLQQLNSYTLETVPHSLMLIGEQGCGKRTFITNLANNLDLELVNISDNCTDTDIAEYIICPIPKMYLIDLRQFLEKDQNKFLKFIEEPSDTCFISVVTNSEIGVLDTILNRCIKLHFAQYTFEELKEIASVFHPNFNELDYQICRTPGKLFELDDAATPKLKALCEQIVSVKAPVKYGHILELYTKINCFENYDQFGFDAFLNMLAYVAFSKFSKDKDERSYNIYKTTADFLKKLTIAPRVNKHDFLLYFFTVLYNEVI